MPNQKRNKNSVGIVVVCVIVVSLLFVILQPLTNKLPYSVPTQERTIISGSIDPNNIKTDTEWKKILTPEQYHILREQGTEIPFTGSLLHETRKGTYISAGCKEAVFRSEQKYDSGTGWPSFWNPIHSDAVVLRADMTLGETRIEVLDTCGGHLGHVFDDGPQPSGKRYCMNSDALEFIPDKEQ